MALRRTIDAATEPVSTAEAKAHLRVVSSADDTLIAALIKTARMQCENELGRSLITQTWQRTVDYFPPEIELAYPPVIAITDVVYLDADGVSTVLTPASYALDNVSEPGWLVPAYSYDWPNTLDAANAVTVTNTAGYGSASDVPQAIKHWIMMAVASMYDNRESSAPGAAASQMLPFVDGLLDPFRVVRFG
jgi:uncharacterized phiE125 gp8 family phage protein